MGLTVVTPAASSLLTTVGRVKDELGIAADDFSNDEVLLRLIARASDAITRECGRTAFGAATYQETLKGSGSQCLALANAPVLSVSQLQEEGADVPTAAADSADGYSILDAEAGVLFRASGWRAGTSALRWGSEATSSRYILPGGTGTLRFSVTYTAGYVVPPPPEDLPYDAAAVAPSLPAGLTVPALPGAIEQATLLTVKAWYFARARDHTIAEQKVGARSVRYEQGASLADREQGAAVGLPTAALGLLRNYRRAA